MNKNIVKENSFEPGVGGTSGTLNYQSGYGTHSSPDVQQNPAHFTHSDKHIGNKGNTVKKATDPEDIDNDINAIYSKKDVPSPDEIITGIKYEMGQQIKKDKFAAKSAVLKNLKRDPHFYSNLKMLNIDDKTMMNNINEEKHPNDSVARTKITQNIEETNKILSQLSKGKNHKYVVNSEIAEVMQDMWKQKQARNLWKKI